MQKKFASNLEENSNATVAPHSPGGCAVVVIDAQKKISLLTPDSANLLGLKLNKILEQGIEVLPETLQKLLEQTLSSGKPVSGKIKIAHASRGEINILVEATPLSGGNGKGSQIVAVLKQSGDAEKTEKNLERMDRLASIGTLSASMAHEIKNALVAIQTFVNLLLSRNQNDELAGMVGREMTRIDSIVSQMLTFSGPAKPVFSPIHLHDVLNHSLRLVEHQLGEKKIKLERSFAASTDLVKGDDYQLKQAFLNLFLNALEATPTSGNLSVVTELTAIDQPKDTLREKTPTHLRILIRDTGAGISPENLDRVFEPFFTTKPKGTGLGLPITRRIIHEHRGTIAVESQLKKGAQFSIVFPLPRENYL
jgi:signal transduction histidine kinase